MLGMRAALSLGEVGLPHFRSALLVTARATRFRAALVTIATWREGLQLMHDTNARSLASFSDENCPWVDHWNTLAFATHLQKALDGSIQGYAAFSRWIPRS